MAPGPGEFALWRIALDAAVALGVSLAPLLIWRRQLTIASTRAAVLLAVVVGLSVLVWRAFANVAPLNNDVIPPISPNDMLSPVVTYAALGWYAAFRLPADAGGWARTRALLALVAFIVNVIVI